jgi:hypothetical protein
LQHVCLLCCAMIISCAVLTGCGCRTDFGAAADCRVWSMPAAGTGA